MNTLKKHLAFFAICISSFVYANEETAVVQQQEMVIQSLETIVEKNRIMVTQKDATYDEVSCDKADAYVISANKKGFESHRALLISAYLSEKPVRLVLKGCSSKRPRIISVIM